MKFDIVRSDNWHGLYVDGCLQMEGSDIDILDIMDDYPSIHLTHITVSMLNQRWMDEERTLPAILANCVVEVQVDGDDC